MSDAPFSFQAARPARKVTTEKVENMTSSDTFVPEGHREIDQPKRKRRTRAEIEAAGTAPLTPTGELAALKACLKQLRSLDDQARARVLLLLKAVFE